MTSPAAAREAELARLRVLRMEVAAGGSVTGSAGLSPHVAAAVDTATDVGAPLLPVLDAVAVGARAERDIVHAVAAAAAPARLVAVSLTLLPVVAVPVLGRISGTNLVAFYGTPGGRLVAIAGIALWLAGLVLTAAIVRGTARTHRDRPILRAAGIGLVAGIVAGVPAGFVVAVVAALWRRPASAHTHPLLAPACDILAAALTAGIPPTTALRVAARRLPDLRSDLLRLAMHLDLARTPQVPAVQPLADVLTTTLRLGSPAVPALHELAAQVRADRLAAALAQAQRMPTRLTFPAALCLLPATLLLVGAPIVAEGLGAVAGT